MSRARTYYIGAVVVFALVLSGCGGAKNPLHTSVHVPRIITGFWDGLTILVSFVFWLFNQNRYAIIASHTGPWYIVGYVLGVFVLISILMSFWGIRRRVRVVRRTY